MIRKEIVTEKGGLLGFLLMTLITLYFAIRYLIKHSQMEMIKSNSLNLVNLVDNLHCQNELMLGIREMMIMKNTEFYLDDIQVGENS
jgi:hypothetical protein